jgi:tripartite-type tricarboxylate transporter receptor subunit TctC
MFNLPRCLKKLSCSLLMSAVFSCLVVTAAHAQTSGYPTKPIKLVVPFPAGGATDILSRGFAEGLAQQLGQAIIVENKPGGGANIGAAFVAHAAPDGYTLLMGSINSHAISMTYNKNPGYSLTKDLVGISTTGSLGNAVFVSLATPANSIAELVALAKANPGKYTCGSSGTGGLIHLTCEMFKIAAGVDILHVPYKGTSILLPDLISDRVTMALDTIPPYLPLLKDGKLKVLAVTTTTRSPLLPGVPTMIEAGYPGFESVAIYGLFAPAGTPTAILEKLNAATNVVTRDTALKQKLAEQGIYLEGSSAQSLNDYAQKQISVWADVLKAGKIASE